LQLVLHLAKSQSHRRMDRLLRSRCEESHAPAGRAEVRTERARLGTGAGRAWIFRERQRTRTEHQQNQRYVEGRRVRIVALGTRNVVSIASFSLSVITSLPSWLSKISELVPRPCRQRKRIANMPS
jgi:hypothetical protein